MLYIIKRNKTMHNEYKVNDFVNHLQKNLPRSAKTNLTKSGKRKPLTQLQVHNLYDKALNSDTFQRTAQKYYKTTHSNTKISELVFLQNEITLRSCVVYFMPLKNNYIRVTQTIQNERCVVYLEFFIQRPSTNKGLFLKLQKLNLI